MRNLPFWMLCIVVALAPLPFGSDRDWASAGLAVAVASIAAFWLLGIASRASPPMVGLSRYVLPAGMLVLLLLWFALQTANFTPESLHHPIWAQSSQALGAPYQGSIAIDPERAVSALMRMITYALVFFIAMQYGRDPTMCMNGIWVVAIAATIYASYGLFEQLSGSNSIFGLRKLYFPEYLTATFENRNSTAAYLGIGVIACIGLMSAEWNRIVGGGMSLRQILLQLSESAGIGLYLLVVCMFVCASALVWTASRGGALVTLVGVMTLLLIIFVIRRPRIWIVTLAVSGFLVGGYAVLVFGGDTLLGRAENWDSLELRFLYFDVALDAIRERPWLGYGLGSFQVVFETFRDAQFDFSLPTVERAHNVFLELAIAGGLGVTIPFAIIILSIGWVLVRGLRYRERHYALPAIGLGVGALVVLHGAFDTSAQVPGIAVTYWFLLGLTFGVALPRRVQRRRRKRRPDSTADTPRNLDVEPA